MQNLMNAKLLLGVAEMAAGIGTLVLVSSVYLGARPERLVFGPATLEVKSMTLFRAGAVLAGTGFIVAGLSMLVAEIG